MNLIEIIADKTMLPSSTVMAFIYTAPYRYKKYYLEKKNGGLREIAQPSRELKIMQRLILDEISRFLPIHESAFAYVEGKSIKQNAAKHRDNAYLLKMDFEDFFNSIKPNDLISILVNNGFDANDETIITLSKLFFYKKTKKSGLALSVGAPSSPWISNAVMYIFDVAVSELCSKNNIIYTRYADDLTFSCKEKGRLIGFDKEVSSILRKIKSPGIRLNLKKTVHASKGVNRRVTGIVINNEGRLSLGRHKKRMISSLIHKYTLKQLSPEEIRKLKGYLSYAQHIEHSFIISMGNKYGVDTLNSIKKES
ncbi:retron St85 family RNA-directed DNA polymerase [Serratia fonticola]